MTPATSAVAAATISLAWLMSPPPSMAPVPSAWVPMMSGFSTTM